MKAESDRSERRKMLVFHTIVFGVNYANGVFIVHKCQDKNHIAEVINQRIKKEDSHSPFAAW